MPTPILCLGLIRVALLIALSHAQDAANLLPNPGFEVAEAGDVAFWETRTPTDAARTLEWTDRAARKGNASSTEKCPSTPLAAWRPS